jgi:hypothetical protein
MFIIDIGMKRYTKDKSRSDHSKKSRSREENFDINWTGGLDDI